jgi:hypothetical protein
MNKKKVVIVFTGILIASTVLCGCIQQEAERIGTLRLQITDKPGDLEITHVNVTISMVQVHKSNATDEEEVNDDVGEIENIDEFGDGFVAFIDDEFVPYFADVGDVIDFEGNATEGYDEPYNWTWDFENDGINDSYGRETSHTYSSAGIYVVNLTVTNNSGNGVRDWYLTTATIGEVDEEDDVLTAGWHTIVEEPKDFDLMALQGVTEVLGEATLPVGKYTQIRLSVERANITIINETGFPEVHDMMIPSNKVKLINPFLIYEDETTELTLDFEVNKSVHQTGNNKFIMKPTIKVIQG